MTDSNLLFVWDPAKSTYETIWVICITAHPAKGDVRPQHINARRPAQWWEEEEASQVVSLKIQFVSSSFASAGV